VRQEIVILLKKPYREEIPRGGEKGGGLYGKVKAANGLGSRSTKSTKGRK